LQIYLIAELSNPPDDTMASSGLLALDFDDEVELLDYGMA